MVTEKMKNNQIYISLASFVMTLFMTFYIGGYRMGQLELKLENVSKIADKQQVIIEKNYNQDLQLEKLNSRVNLIEALCNQRGEK